jgi:hypothetical protein
VSKYCFCVEGKSDEKFLKDYVQTSFNVILKEHNFLITNGFCDKWFSVNKPFIQRVVFEHGLTPVIVLDSNGDFEKRKKQLVANMAEEGFNFKIFLLPNDKDAGNLDTLLLSIINQKHATILDCFDKYVKCIGGYELPDEKAKLFAYLDARTSNNQKKR